MTWTAVRGGTFQVGGGGLLGLGLAATMAPLLGNLFMGYQPGDPVAYGAATLTLLATGMAAASGPARRASRGNVAEVSRRE